MGRALFLGLCALVSAQPPSGGGSDDGSTGTYCDMCGASSTYTETLDTSGSYAKRNVVATGCPNHYAVCTGKDGTDGCGDVGVEGSDTQATVQDHDLDIPASPVLATTTTDWPGCVTYEIGIALNGVPIYGGAVSDDCGWSYGEDCSACILDVEDEDAEWTSFDFCGGHGRCLGSDCSGYHYHFPPSCLETQIGPMADGHSPQVGWSLDGFPIYGPFGPGGVAIKNCGADGADATYCQDACGGYAGELSDIDDFKYRYYFSGPIADLVTLPTNPRPATSDYPFAMACYVGCTMDDLESGEAKCTGGTSGVTDNYAATVTAGITDVFVSGPASDAGMLCSSTTATDDSTAATDDTPAPTPAPTPAAATNDTNVVESDAAKAGATMASVGSFLAFLAALL